MLIEKLLLHVLIILAPIFVFNVFLDNRRIGYSPYIHGLMGGAASLLCMIFSFYSHGLYWDLRYVPLIYTFLYSGPIAGGMVVIAILAGRTYLGGDATVYGYVSCIISCIVPLLMAQKFRDFQPRKRIMMALAAGSWPSFVSLSIFLVFLAMRDIPIGTGERFADIIITGLIQMLALWLCVIIIEQIVEKVKMKKSIERAEKLNTMGELAASIAHEVRNPLTVVKGFLQMMEQEKAGNYPYLKLVLSELDRAESIITDYLNFAKPQFEQMERIQMEEVIADMMHLLYPLALRHGVEMESRLNGNVMLTADKDKLKQALVNFTKNAIEAMENGGTVTIVLDETDEHVYIRIKDTGKGMNETQVQRIGTLFYTTKDKGTGLGTAVSMRIIEAMHGHVTYNSQPGIGTEVMIMLPYK